MIITLAHHDGTLGIELADTMHGKPERVISFYPCFECSAYDARSFAIGAQLRIFDNHGTYIYADSSLPRVTFQTKDGGRTIPTATRTEPVPPPKVRKGTEIRWQYGQWEKYTKTGGWKTA